MEMADRKSHHPLVAFLYHCSWYALADFLCLPGCSSSRKWQVARGALVRAGPGILIGHGNVAVPQGIAHDGERGLMVDGMGTMAMPQPVGRNLVPVGHPGPLGGLAYNAKDGGRVQPRALIVSLARDLLARAEDEIRVRGPFPQCREDVPGTLRQQHVALLVALAAHNIELDPVCPPDNVTPAQVA